MREIVIIGSKGQDGQLLNNILQNEDNSIIGLDVNFIDSTNSTWKDKVDISSYSKVSQLIQNIKPSQVYFLSAHHQSSEDPKGNLYELIEKSYNVNVFSYLNFLESIRNYSMDTRIFYAASSHIFGYPKKPFQDESSEFNPRSIYGITKLDGLFLSRYYRDNFSVFSSVGILYNHESQYRKDNFVSKKIVKAAVAIKNGMKSELVIGDINAQVDWGYAGDYVKAMIAILDQNEPDDFVIASGRRIKIMDFISVVFEYLDIDWKKYVRESPEILSRINMDSLCGNPKKLTNQTGWKSSFNLKDLAKMMVDYEISSMKS